MKTKSKSLAKNLDGCDYAYILAATTGIDAHRLIERNALLMNKAEEQKNSDRLAKITIFKFMPMGASALKLIVDMGVFLIVFISQSLGSMTF